MTTFIETAHPTEGIISEANGLLSRDTVTIAASQTILPGAVLGKVTATGHYAALVPEATDGSQTAAAIALYPAATAAGQTKAIAALTRDAEFRRGALVFAAGVDTAEQTAAIAQLASAHIIIRA
jgi:hypothetical protein